jgi:predicted DNA-binding transcriptional regulator AlpA
MALSPPETPPTPKTLTPRQVQEIYGFSEDTLATWRRREIADGVRRGPRWIPFGAHAIRYRVVDVEEWIEQRVRNRVAISRAQQAANEEQPA